MKRKSHPRLILPKIERNIERTDRSLNKQKARLRHNSGQVRAGVCVSVLWPKRVKDAQCCYSTGVFRT